MNERIRLLACLLVAMVVLSPSPAASYAADEEAAVKALMRVASQIEKNRDGSVRFVRFSRPTVTDDDLRHITAFSKIDYLAVVTPTITDEGLKHIAGLTNLEG